MFAIVQFNDEAPAIGSGTRMVFVTSSGPSWVSMINVYSLRTARVKRRQWEDMRPRSHTPTLKAKTAMRKNARKILRLTGQRKTIPIKQLLEGACP